MSPQARVWIYPTSRPLTEQEAKQILDRSQRFIDQWSAHGAKLEADTRLLHKHFLVIAVNEASAAASGCSIDASVHFIRQLGAEMDIDFFDRMLFHYRAADGSVQSLPRAEFRAAYDRGDLTGSTFVFDPLVKTVAELEEQFEKPLERSWHARMV